MLSLGGPTFKKINGRHFVKNHLKSEQKRPVLEWSGFRMVCTIAIAIPKGQPF